jgi:hypothetical protein
MKKYLAILVLGWAAVAPMVAGDMVPTQKEVIERIYALKGMVAFNEEKQSKPVDAILLSNVRLSDKDFLLLKTQTACRQLYLEGVPVRDDTLNNFNEWTRLEVLDLTNSGITDQGLVHLKNHPKLVALSLMNTKVTDRGLAHLQKLVNLRLVFLSGAQVTDNGAKRLQKALPKLKVYRQSPMNPFWL